MFTFITVNVNGLHDPNKRMSFLQWLRHLSADVVCLQECQVLSCAEADSWFSPYGFLTLLSPESVHLFGSVILHQSTITLVKSSYDRQGHLVLAHFMKDDLTFGVACLYAAN